MLTYDNFYFKSEEDCQKFEKLPAEQKERLIEYAHGEAKLEERRLAIESELNAMESSDKGYERKKKELERHEKEMKLYSHVGDQEISKGLKRHLLRVIDREKIYLRGPIQVADPETAAFATERSEWGGSGGIGKYSQIYGYYKGQTKMREWMYRDRFDPALDDWNKKAYGIAKLEVEDMGDSITLKATAESNYRPTVAFSFKKKDAPKSLPEEEQAAFVQKVENEIEKIIGEKEALWEAKPQMSADYPGIRHVPDGFPSHVSYDRPCVKSKAVREDLGIAAFAVEEQIDHFTTDKQFRYQVYVYKDGEGIKEVYEDHEWEKGVGSALVSITDLSGKEVTLNTREGVVKIAI